MSLNFGYYINERIHYAICEKLKINLTKKIVYEKNMVPQNVYLL